MHNDIFMRYDGGMIRHMTKNNAQKILMKAIMVMMAVMMKMTMATMTIQTCNRMDDQRSYSDHKLVQL